MLSVILAIAAFTSFAALAIPTTIAVAQNMTEGNMTASGNTTTVENLTYTEQTAVYPKRNKHYYCLGLFIYLEEQGSLTHAQILL